MRPNLLRRDGSGRGRARSTSFARACPRVESLEGRQLLTALYVEPLNYGQFDVNHYSTLQNAIGAARPGDVITIEPGATVVPIQRTSGLLSAPVAVGATTIQTNVQLPTGQFVNLGVNGPRVLVDGVRPGPAGTYIATLSQPIATSLLSGLAVLPDTSAIGLDKPITIIGDQVSSRFGSNLSLEIAPGAGLGTVLMHLNLSSLKLDQGIQAVLVSDCAIASTVDNSAGGNTFVGNMFSGPFTVAPGSGTAPNDVIKGNTFADGSGQVGLGPMFLASQANYLDLSENIFDLTGLGSSAISIVNSSGVAIARNTIQAASTQPQVLITGPAANATVSNNVISSSGLGTGVQVSAGSALIASSTSVKVEGNDLRNNRVGLYILGDGLPLDPAGAVDAGGGSLGSAGGNDFRGMTAAGVASGIFAIQVTGAATSYTVPAMNNIWDDSVLANPATVVKDAAHNGLLGLLATPGTGTINVGTTQLTKDQEFVQSLFNQFLGRTAPISGLAGYVSQIATIGRSGVANNLLHSDESYQNLIEKTYVRLFGRYADPYGLNAYTNFLHTHSEEQFLGSILGSTEFANRAKSSTGSPDLNSSFLQYAYGAEAGRSPTVDELDAGVNQIVAQGRQSVANMIPTTSAVRQNMITYYYSSILNRNYATTPAEIQNYDKSGLSLLDIQISMAGSAEFYAKG